MTRLTARSGFAGGPRNVSVKVRGRSLAGVLLHFGEFGLHVLPGEVHEQSVVAVRMLGAGDVVGDRLSRSSERLVEALDLYPQVDDARLVGLSHFATVERLG